MFPQDRVAFLVLLPSGALSALSHTVFHRVLLGACRLYRSDHRRRQSRRDWRRVRMSSCWRSRASRSASGSRAPASSSPVPISAPASAHGVICESRGIMGRFDHMLALTEAQLADNSRPPRVRPASSLDPVIDQALGDQPRARSRASGHAAGRGWTAGAELRRISVVCPRLQGGRRPKSSCETSRPGFDRYRRRDRRCSGSLILWPRAALARRRCGH